MFLVKKKMSVRKKQEKKEVFSAIARDVFLEWRSRRNVSTFWSPGQTQLIQNTLPYLESIVLKIFCFLRALYETIHNLNGDSHLKPLLSSYGEPLPPQKVGGCIRAERSLVFHFLPLPYNGSDGCKVRSFGQQRALHRMLRFGSDRLCHPGCSLSTET